MDTGDICIHAWKPTRIHKCTCIYKYNNTHTQKNTHSHTLYKYLSIIQNSCCAKNELTVPVLAVALNIDFLKKY